MSEPHEPGQPGGVPPTEQEPAPSAVPPAAEHAQVPPESPAAETTASPTGAPSEAQATTAMPPPPGGQAGHYVFVPAGASAPRARRFGPAMGRLVRNRATHLVAAVVVGAVVGGGTVAVVDNAANGHQQRAPFSRGGGPFQGGDGHQLPGFRFGGGGQGSGN